MTHTLVRDAQIILGLSYNYHDSAAVLVVEDDIVAAAQEERFTRRKFDNRFPVNAIKYCIEEGKVRQEDVHLIAFYEEPHLKLERVLETQTSFAPLNFIRNTKRIKNWIDNKYSVEDDIEYFLPRFDGKILFFPHHLSHAASAFYPSPFKEAAILTVDGVGEWGCSAISTGKENEIEMIREQRFPHSIGLLYSTFTQYIGFKVDSGEYKLMGLAPYGNSVYVNKIKDNLVQINSDGSIKLNIEYFDFMTGNQMLNERFCKLFGGKQRNSESPITQKEMDIACSIQSVTEEILLKMVKYAVEITCIKSLCMAGGVALNCVANGKILRSGLIEKIWIQPAAGDAGGALGAALLAAYKVKGIHRKTNGITDRQKGSLLGPSFSNDKIKKLLDAYGFVYEKIPNEVWADRIALLLSEGKVVALFQGRMEYGPRALGCRSILGDPRIPDMQSKMNLKIKFRESFRPFAPVVLKERVRDWFAMDVESPYMLLVSEIIADKKKNLSVNEQNFTGIDKLKVVRSEIPAVTHIDYSARIQTVDKNVNQKMYAILSAFEKLTGCPVLINTSFNIRGEPIVCIPFDALKCFMNTNIDAFVLENYILYKENQTDVLKDKNFAKGFEPD